MPQACGSAVLMDLLLLLAVTVAMALVPVLTVAVTALTRRRLGGQSAHRHACVRERDPTRRPRMLALLGSGIGLVVASIGFTRYLLAAARENTERIELFSAVLIGALIFAACAIAFCKLRGVLQLEAAALPGHHVVNLFALLLCGWLGYSFVTEQAQPFGLAALLATGALALAMGVHLMLSREYRGNPAHAAHHDSCAPRMRAFAARSDGLALGKPGLLANIEWHGGEEQTWALRDVAPALMRLSAYADRRNGRDGRRSNGRPRDCSCKCTHKRPAHFTTRR
ncbi:NAD(P) transhydrogenase beta subunit [Paraburkholderia atlantica]|uniref:NAD(P) transhydrogenase beta subunit n=1 Tax=Paraburkholderia atlantica TaxID=2654982 RepID=D5WFM1_PARAM|nr:NAD(P)(+) transhydrogenase (Re/Si-specific) subunit beta [Paraburkholderia atlantica]ADG17411.1 NAD(P) transhydrogenase beta subunit [Paraburkholderia atlantica]